MKPQRACESLEETRQRLRQQINALHRKRGTYAAYGDPVKGDSLLPAIAALEQQLLETHKPQHRERR